MGQSRFGGGGLRYHLYAIGWSPVHGYILFNAQMKRFCQSIINDTPGLDFTE